MDVSASVSEPMRAPIWSETANATMRARINNFFMNYYVDNVSNYSDLYLGIVTNLRLLVFQKYGFADLKSNSNTTHLFLLFSRAFIVFGNLLGTQNYRNGGGRFKNPQIKLAMRTV